MKQHVATLLMALALSLAPGRPSHAQLFLTDQRVISVTGEGIAHARPDIAIVALGVVSEAESAAEALSANTAAMSRLLDGLKAESIEARDLQTAIFSIKPRYSKPPRDDHDTQPFTPRIVGYTVQNDLTVRIRDVGKLGLLLDKAITLGANSISGPTFALDDPTAQEDAAFQAATRDALRQGKLLADAAGVALGPIVRIGGDSGGRWEQTQTAMRGELAPSPPVPIEPGEITFRAHTSVSWRIAE
jgi:uncharacterized protein YggE